MKKETGGAAFPSIEHMSRDFDGFVGEGMTLRDYFAARILAAYINRGRDFELDHVPALASEAYAIADAMLRERAK